jgi:hypothetical protein
VSTYGATPSERLQHEVAGAVSLLAGAPPEEYFSLLGPNDEVPVAHRAVILNEYVAPTTLIRALAAVPEDNPASHTATHPSIYLVSCALIEIARGRPDGNRTLVDALFHSIHAIPAHTAARLLSLLVRTLEPHHTELFATATPDVFTRDEHAAFFNRSQHTASSTRRGHPYDRTAYLRRRLDQYCSPYPAASAARMLAPGWHGTFQSLLDTVSALTKGQP